MEHGVARIRVIPNWNTYVALVKIQCYLSASQTNMDIGFTSGHSSEALPITKNTSIIHRFIFFFSSTFLFSFQTAKLKVHAFVTLTCVFVQA